MQRHAAHELDVRHEPRIRGLLGERFRLLEDVERAARIAGRVGHGREPAQGIRLAARIADLVVDIAGLGVRPARELPFLERSRARVPRL